MSDPERKYGENTVAFLHGRVHGLEEQLAGLQAEVAKWKEIAEENDGEHVKLETLREELGELIELMRKAETDEGNSVVERNATHFWRLAIEQIEHYPPAKPCPICGRVAPSPHQGCILR